MSSYRRQSVSIACSYKYLVISPRDCKNVPRDGPACMPYHIIEGAKDLQPNKQAI